MIIHVPLKEHKEKIVLHLSVYYSCSSQKPAGDHPLWGIATHHLRNNGLRGFHLTESVQGSTHCYPNVPYSKQSGVLTHQNQIGRWEKKVKPLLIV